MSSRNSASKSATNGRAPTGRSAPSAPLNGTKSATNASPSRSTNGALSGSAITADIPDPSQGKLSAAAIEYAKGRGISRATLERLGAAAGTAYFPRRLKRKSQAVFFPYALDEEVVNWKACAFPDKDFIGKKGGRQCFLGLDEVLRAEPGDVWITEGEWDKAALVEAGLAAERVLSVPNGAREHRGSEEGEELSGYGYVEEALSRGLGKHKRFIWCGDADAAGLALRSDMSRLLGQARFWFVDWPEGCKDANDYLRFDGAEAVKDLVTDGVRPWPVAGVYALAELPEEAAIEAWRVPHMPGWGTKIRLAPGTLSAVVGHPGHGKTALWAQIWHDIAAAYDIGVAVATFETRPKPYFRRILRRLHAGKWERDLTDAEKAEADGWIQAHYAWVVHPEQKPTLDWLLEMGEVAVVRQGVKVLQIDPWNRMESQRERGETETEYIGRCLTACYVFATDMGVHVQILAHPAKTDKNQRGKPPELEDAAGSKHFDNRVDQGFVVHRPKMFEGGEPKTEALLIHRKTRFEELGHPCRLNIKYDWTTGRFTELANDKVNEPR